MRGQDSNLRPPGYEPDELPTAPPRDIKYKVGAEDRGRTGTIGKDHRILSPACLPIPPLRQVLRKNLLPNVLAPRVGLEPTAYRLTAGCSTIELPWNITWLRLTLPGGCPPSTISAQELNFCVRNGNRCILLAIITTYFYTSTILTFFI